MSTRAKLEELRLRSQEIELGGGAKAIEKQHERGKYTARERLTLLFDEGSFTELDKFVTHRCVNFGMENTFTPAEGVVTGYGTIDGRLVYAFAQDFTVVGGSLGEMHAKKICKVLDLALKMGAPCIGINDSGGARIQEAIDALSGYGDIFYRNTISSGVIPQLSVIMGPCAGGAVYSPAITDFVFMVKNTSQMFITGPQVIKAVTGEEVSAEKLGGAMTHNSVSGVAHFAAENEEECILQIRALLSYIPNNNLEEAPVFDTGDDPERRDETLNDIIPDNPNAPYDIKDVVIKVADNGEIFEVQPYYAQNIVTAFIRLNGKSIGVIANQPKYMAGCLDINASDKSARFIRFCDAFNIPILTVVDVPGFLPGVNQEFGGIIRHGAKMLYAYSEATVPKVTLITRKAYGGAYIAMSSRHLGGDQVIAWPTAEIAVMGASGAANIIFRKDIEAAQDKEAKRNEIIKQYEERFATPYVAAERGYVDMVIEPAVTRPVLINAFEMLATKRETRPAKKHGNIPL
ncbi:MAG: methylmalonyl-CoA carboxyltransferase [Clostridiaceae bacterium BRH_c20a]|nr:MAG: methylmalonyl-CoA carboxyltransferase [Clostridiaceae bacterium BRH_c20a]